MKIIIKLLNLDPHRSLFKDFNKSFNKLFLFIILLPKITRQLSLKGLNKAIFASFIETIQFLLYPFPLSIQLLPVLLQLNLPQLNLPFLLGLPLLFNLLPNLIHQSRIEAFLNSLTMAIILPF